jgi:hypothetical protein
MQSFQSRLLAKIAAQAEAHGAEVSQSSDFSNVGRVNLHQHGEIVPAIVVGFDVQPSTYKLTLTVRGERVPSQVGRAGYFDFFQAIANESRFWECYAAALVRVFGKAKRAKAAARVDALDAPDDGRFVATSVRAVDGGFEGEVFGRDGRPVRVFIPAKEQA